MLKFNPEDQRRLPHYVSDLRMWFQDWLLFPVQRALGITPTQLSKIYTDLQRLEAINEDTAIEDDYAPLLKRVLLFQKRKIGERQEQRRSMTTHRELLRNIEDEMAPVTRLMSEEWFDRVESLRMPPLTEFLTLQAAHNYLPTASTRPEFKFDEKFGILQAPAGFLPNLGYCRIEGWLRNTNISVAFIDIDDFKRFNTRYTETFVDRDVLPRIMQTLESQVFSHGWAYRFGGDEYILLLPNLTLDNAEQFLLELQRKLMVLEISGVNELVTVSIGLCNIVAESFLTDKEVQEKANKAKEHAKKVGNKNCIASFKGNLFRDDDLYISARSVTTAA